MMRQNFYKEFARIYDQLINSDVDYDQWTSFIMSKIQGKCHMLLEAACGTGNITSLLAYENLNITAFDISEDMLMKSYDKLRRFRNVRILNQDMTSFKIDNKFDACICCCDGLNYLNIEEVNAFFRNVYNHLTESGIFIFDISTEYKYINMSDTYVYDEGNIFYVWENTKDMLCDVPDVCNNSCNFSAKTDPDKNENENEGKIDMDITFFVKSNDNDLYQRINEQQTHFMHRTDRIKQILIDIGFSNINIYDGYTDNRIKDTSIRATFVCSK